jgi:flagellar biosynthetic protein FliR
MMVFVRVSAMLAIFPVFSSTNFPVQLRIALGALVAYLVSASLPPLPTAPLGFGGLVVLLVMEVCIGLLLGFISRMIFYALDAAGNVVATEIGLMLSADFNPLSGVRSDAPGMILNYLAIVLFFSFDMHHWFLLALQRSYNLVPIGAARLSEVLFHDVVARTAGIFVVAVQISAPVIAVSFIVTLVFSVLGRAVPQMNVFGESFAFRILAGLTVFGLTLNLTAQHISNYLRRLPEDVLRVAQLLGAG